MDQFIKEKRVVFITTKNLDYLRNTQEIKLLLKHTDSVTIIGSHSKSYPKRLLYVYYKLLTTSFRKVDTVFIGFAPQLVLPFWNWKFRNCNVIEDFFISMYDTMVCDRQKFKDGGFISNVLKYLDKLTISKADSVISDTKAHGEYFINELGCSPEKLNVLYLEADTSIYYPRETSNTNFSNHKVLYFGSILPLQGVDIVLKAAEILADNSSITFEIIGPVAKDAMPSKGNIIYHSWLNQEELANHIAQADLCLAGHFCDSIMKAKRTIPGKAYIYHAMNKPMILGDNPANHELFSTDEKGILFVKMGDAQALAEEILKYFGEVSNNLCK